MSKLITILWILSILFTATSVQAQSNVWTESWDSSWESRWDYFGGRGADCSHTQSGIFIQDCWATAIVSHQKFPVDQRIEFTGTIFTRPGINSPSSANLAHHVLFSIDDGPNGEYCGLYFQYDPNTRRDIVMSISYIHNFPNTAKIIGRIFHGVHEVTILWEPRGTRVGFGTGRQEGSCSYIVDGELLLKVPYGFVMEEVVLWQGATSVAWGQGDDGSTSFARHGPITVTVGR